MPTILIVLILLLLLGGGGVGYHNGFNTWNGGGVFATALVICLLIWLFGGLRS